MKNYYTTFEAAQICHVSQGSMIRWIHQGKIPASVTPGGHHRIEARNLTRFLQRLRMPVPKILDRHTERFLIVTENASLTLTLKRLIQALYTGSQVEEAKDYFTAGWKASRISPDLVIADLEETPAEALKMCGAIRLLPEFNRIPFLMLVPHWSEALQRKIAEIELCAWIEKPFHKDSVSEKIRTLLIPVQFQKTGS